MRLTAVIFLIIMMLSFTFMSCFSQEKPQEQSEGEKHAIEGLNFYNGGNYEGAKEELKKAIELEPDNKDYKEALIMVYKGSALSLFNMGKYDDAIKEYETALSKKPDDVELNYNLAYVYNTKENYEKAKIYYAKCLELDPKGDFAEASYLYLGNIYFSEENYEKALVNYKGAVELKGDSILNAHYNLGMCYLKTGKLDEAEKEFLEAKKLNPSIAVIYGQLGEVYMKKKDYDKALENYKQAVNYDSSNYEFQVGLGKAEEEKGDLSAAIEAYNSAISLNSTDAEVRYLLGAVYYGQKSYDKASEQLEKAVSLDPENKLYKETLDKVKTKLTEMETKKNNIRFVDSTIDSIYFDGEKLEDNNHTIYLDTLYDIEIVYKDGTTLSGTLKLLDNDTTLEKGYKFGKVSETDRENARLGGSGTIYLLGSDGSQDVEIVWEGSMQ